MYSKNILVKEALENFYEVIHQIKLKIIYWFQLTISLIIINNI